MSKNALIKLWSLRSNNLGFRYSAGNPPIDLTPTITPSSTVTPTHTIANTATPTSTAPMLTPTMTVTPTVTSNNDPYTLRAPLSNDFYADPNASVDGSGTLASPWKTLTKARIQSMSSGQGLWIREGSIAWPDVDSGGPNGTALAPTFVASYPEEFATLTFTGFGQKLCGSNYFDFHTVGLSCVNNGICLGENCNFSGSSTPSTNIRFIDCVGTRSAMDFDDNSGIIFASTGTWPISVIRGSYTGPTNTPGTVRLNQSLLWFDFAHSCTIIGVLVDLCTNPIYFKHTTESAEADQQFLVKNCIIRRANSARGFQAAANWVQYINNVFDSCNLGMDESGGSIAGGNNCILNHNTFFNSTIGLEITDGGTHTHENNTLLNNVFIGTSLFADNPSGGNGNQNQNNLSNYSACSGTGTNHYYRNSTQRTLSQQQTTFSDQEINGLAGTITLVGGSSPGSIPANWALTSGSIGIGNASDGGDRGVNASNLLTVN